MPSRTLAFFQFFNRKLDNILWILQGHTYIVSENKRKQSNSQKGWRYRPLNRKMFIKLSKPQPLCTKVKNSEKWSFNNFTWFPTLHTNIVLWYMIVLLIWEAEKRLKSIILGKIAYFTGLGGRHWESFISILDHPIYIPMLGTCISIIDMLLVLICIGFTIEIGLF